MAPVVPISLGVMQVLVIIFSENMTIANKVARKLS